MGVSRLNDSQDAFCAGYVEHVYTRCMFFSDNPDLVTDLVTNSFLPMTCKFLSCIIILCVCVCVCVFVCSDPNIVIYYM